MPPHSRRGESFYHLRLPADAFHRFRRSAGVFKRRKEKPEIRQNAGRRIREQNGKTEMLRFSRTTAGWQKKTSGQRKKNGTKGSSLGPVRRKQRRFGNSRSRRRFSYTAGKKPVPSCGSYRGIIRLFQNNPCPLSHHKQILYRNAHCTSSDSQRSDERRPEAGYGSPSAADSPGPYPDRQVSG